MLSDLNELKTFHEVLKRGSLSSAARALGVSAAVVSKRLITLESRVGARLVNRTTRSLAPTERGMRLLADVERVLDALQQGERALVDGDKDLCGLLTVAAPITFGRTRVAPVLGDMSRRHSGLRIRLRLEDRRIDLAADRVDVAIWLGASEEPTTSVRRLANSERILVAAPSYLAAKGVPTAPADLCRHDFLRYGGATGPLGLVDRGGSSVEVVVNPRLTVDNGDVVHAWCVAGHGIFMECAVDVAADLADGRLARVLPGWSGGRQAIVAVFRSDRPLIKMFVDNLADALGSSPG